MTEEEPNKGEDVEKIRNEMAEETTKKYFDQEMPKLKLKGNFKPPIFCKASKDFDATI